MLDLPPCWQACWISKVDEQQGVDADLRRSRLLTAICSSRVHTHKIANHLSAPLELNMRRAYIYSLTVDTLCAGLESGEKKFCWPENMAVISRCVGLMKAWKVEWRVALSHQPHSRMTLSMRVHIISSLIENIYFSRSPGWLAWLNLNWVLRDIYMYMIYMFNVTLALCEMQRRPFQLHVEASWSKRVNLCARIVEVIIVITERMHSSFLFPLIFSSPFFSHVNLKIAVSCLESKEDIYTISTRHRPNVLSGWGCCHWFALKWISLRVLRF